MSKRPQSAVAKLADQSGKAEKPAAVRPQGSRIEITVDGGRLEVSPELDAAVKRALAGLAQPLPKEMTTTQAAEFLDVSRPFVIKLIRKGELPCRLVGKHRRIPTPALLAYR